MENELLAHQITTVKHGVALGKQSEEYIAAMKAIVRKRVSGFDAEKRTSKRLQVLIEKISKELSVPAGKYRKQLEKELKAFARYEIDYQVVTMGDWLNVDFTSPSVESVWSAARFNPLSLGSSPIDFNDMLNNWESGEVARLSMGVKAGFVDGLSATQIIKNVVGAGGLADISKRNAMTNAQTMLMHVANQARLETYKANDDIVIGWTIVATLDSSTSDICRSEDGKTYLFTDKIQKSPPFHFRCRTSTKPKLSPEFDIFNEGATRASKGDTGGKQVDADKTYYSWLKGQPAQFQDEVLGKAKGKIFRNSGLDAEEFRRITVDDLGRPLTLDEMSDRDSRVKSYMQKVNK